MFRLHIAEKWEPQDYIAAISAVETTYYVTLFGSRGWRPDDWDLPQRYYYGRNPWSRDRLAELIVEEARAIAVSDERLIVSQIRHASPGFLDFEGVGKVAEAIDRSFGRIIDVLVHRRMRRELDERAKVETDILRENLNSIKIENARKLLDLYRDYPEVGHQPDLERTLVDQQTKIEDFAARGLITDKRDHDFDE